MAKQSYVQANKDWLAEKAKEEGVMALPKGMYYKVLAEGNKNGRFISQQNSDMTSFLSQAFPAVQH